MIISAAMTAIGTANLSRLFRRVRTRLNPQDLKPWGMSWSIIGTAERVLRGFDAIKLTSAFVCRDRTIKVAR